jgi:sugar/nucleoside kinase (ribokinase family)
MCAIAAGYFDWLQQGSWRDALSRAPRLGASTVTCTNAQVLIPFKDQPRPLSIELVQSLQISSPKGPPT